LYFPNRQSVSFLPSSHTKHTPSPLLEVWKLSQEVLMIIIAVQGFTAAAALTGVGTPSQLHHTAAC
jgi:hypothetical protein